MSTATAAYCSACQAHVFVTAEGGCEYGHSRSSLRGIYSAEVDRRTGRPKAPAFERSAHGSRPVAPVAPVALFELQPLERPEPYEPSHISISAPCAPVISAMGPGVLPRAFIANDARGGLRRVFGHRIGGLARHSNSDGLVRTPFLVALAAVAMLAVGVSVVL